MISFYDMWLRIDEITKLSQLDSSGVELKRIGDDFDEDEAYGDCARNMNDGDIDWDEEDDEDEDEDEEDSYVLRKRKREEQERKRDEAREEMIRQCVDEKEEEWERDQKGKPAMEYEYKFTVDERDVYEVSFSRHSGVVEGNTIDVWDLIFTRNGRTALTGTSGGGAVKVYSKMLAAIKKLTEIEDVKGFKFYGAHPFMDIMYDKFLKALGNFVPVHTNYQSGFLGNDLFVRKDLLKDVESHKDFGKEHDDRIGRIKTLKEKLRNLMVDKSKIVGKVTGWYSASFSSTLPAVVIDINNQGIKLLVFNPDATWKKWDQQMTDEIYVTPRMLGNIKSPENIAPGFVEDMVQSYDGGDVTIKQGLLSRGISNFDGSTYDLKSRMGDLNLDF